MPYSSVVSIFYSMIQRARMLKELIIGKRYTVKVDGCLTFRGMLISKGDCRLHFVTNKAKKNVIVESDRVEILHRWK